MNGEAKLKPCPFCGNAPTDVSYDRAVVIECKPCGYRMAYPGLLQYEPDKSNRLMNMCYRWAAKAGEASGELRAFL